MVIATVGAGGKTAIGRHIGKQLAAEGRRVLLTTTTKIYMPEDEAVDLGGAAGIRAQAPYMAAAQSVLPGGKLQGYAPQDIGVISGSGLFDAIIVEADGAARKPVKAPNAAEPVYPVPLDLVIGLVGADCLGKPVSGDFVHRPELFCAVTDASRGDIISAQHILRLISHPEGLFRNAPAAVPRVVFLNKSDTMDKTVHHQAEEIIRLSPYTVLLTGYGRDWFGEFRRRFLERLIQSKGE